MCIRDRYNIDYFLCSNCGFLQTEEPYWLKEAYSESINISDTGILSRNLNLSKKVTTILSLFFDKHGKFLDYAGGYGIFVRLMRDIGFDFYWYDKYTENLVARGFEYKDDTKYEVLTSFESFEHFENPIDEIENMLKISKNILFTTELLPSPVPIPSNWWYYGLDHGQHISFYSDRTLKYIARKYGLYYYNFGILHLMLSKPVPKYIKYILKLSRFGLFNILKKGLKSKTWDDYLKVSKKI